MAKWDGSIFISDISEVKIDPLKIEALRVFFFEKMAESRPPLFFNFRGDLFSFINHFFQKTTKCLKLTLENGQKSGFYIVKFPNLQREGLPWVPQVFLTKKYQNVFYICIIASPWKCFRSIPKPFLNWQIKWWKTAWSETSAI